jgi:type I restriction enzyme S subunit
VDRLQANGQGSTFVELSTDALASTPLPVPPPAAQRKIADLLDSETAGIDALVGKSYRLMGLLEERISTITERWYQDLCAYHGDLLLRRWVETIEQGWSPVCDSEPAAEGEWGVLKTSAVSSGRFIASENKRLPMQVEPELRWAVGDGDLLVTRGSGSLNMVGRAAVAKPEGRDLMLSDLLYRLRLPEVAAEFVAAVLGSSGLRSQIENSIRSDAGQTLKLRRDDILDLVVPDVPANRQDAALMSLQGCNEGPRSVISAMTHQIRLLKERRQALITAAVTGELDIPGVAA